MNHAVRILTLIITCETAIFSLHGFRTIITQVGTSNAYINALTTVANPSGQPIIVAGGTALNNYTFCFALARYSIEGELIGQPTITTFGTNYAQITALTTVTDPLGQQIIIAGGSIIINNVLHSVLARYTIDGVLISQPIITRFGTNGAQITALTTITNASGHQTIIAGGFAQNTDGKNCFIIARYTTEGNLIEQPTITPIETGNSMISALTIATTSSGQQIFIAAGSAQDATGRNCFALARYTFDGHLIEQPIITPVGKGGASINALMNITNSLGQQIIIAGGYAQTDSNKDCFALARYTIDGNLIGQPIITSMKTGEAFVNALTNISDLKGQPLIIAGGYTRDNNGRNYFVFGRYTINGTLAEEPITIQIGTGNATLHALTTAKNQLGQQFYIAGGSAHKDGKDNFALLLNNTPRLFTLADNKISDKKYQNQIFTKLRLKKVSAQQVAEHYALIQNQVYAKTWQEMQDDINSNHYTADLLDSEKDTLKTYVNQMLAEIEREKRSTAAEKRRQL